MFFTDAEINNFAIHSIRESLGDKEILLSEDELSLDEDLTLVLKTYLFKKFERPNSLFHFIHEHDLSMNEVFVFCQMIFEGESDFLEVSQAISNFLYTKSRSSSIKTGEVYITKISGVVFEDQVVDAIGIFKSENKDTFLKVYPDASGFGISADQGININKLDKGAVILNVEHENGYVVGMIDNTNKQEQAKYWKDDFLGVDYRSDVFHQTQQTIDVVKGFVEQGMPEADQIEKIDFMHRSFEYLNENEAFNQEEFKEIVLQSPETKAGFDEFVQTLPEEYNFDMEEDFRISKPAIKNNKKYIRSVIKLDKNYHIYVHGRRDWIERGMDQEKQLHYYKVYFENES